MSEARLAPHGVPANENRIKSEFMRKVVIQNITMRAKKPVRNLGGKTHEHLDVRRQALHGGQVARGQRHLHARVPGHLTFTGDAEQSKMMYDALVTVLSLPDQVAPR